LLRKSSSLWAEFTEVSVAAFLRNLFTTKASNASCGQRTQSYTKVFGCNDALFAQKAENYSSQHPCAD
jgi:hypothetical protein